MKFWWNREGVSAYDMSGWTKFYRYRLTNYRQLYCDVRDMRYGWNLIHFFIMWYHERDRLYSNFKNIVVNIVWSTRLSNNRIANFESYIPVDIRYDFKVPHNYNVTTNAIQFNLFLWIELNVVELKKRNTIHRDCE